MNKYLISLLTSSILTCSISPAWGQDNIASEITFSCDRSNEIPIMVAKNKRGQSSSILAIKEDLILVGKQTPWEFCQTVASKMNELNENYDMSTWGLLITHHTSDFIAICAFTATTYHSCTEVLFLAFTKQENKLAADQDILETILDPELIGTDRVKRERSVRCFAYIPYRVTLGNLYEYYAEAANQN